jgi:serine/threonine-protein kinase HipA
MKLASGAPLRVSLRFAPDRIVPVGRLALDRGRAALEYAPAFVQSGLTINPRWAPPSRDLVWAAEPRVFAGLHGVFNDSLPDAWGRELMRRRALAHGFEPASLTALDQLSIVGHRGAGALIYEPAVAIDEPMGELDVDALGRESLDVLAGLQGNALLTTLEQLGDSSGGARPKILVAIDAAGNLRAGAGVIPPGYRAWIVKFRAPRDRADAGPLEAAYADMARAAGIDIAPTTLLPSRRGEFDYFATQRFDRGAHGERLHVLSAAGLLDTPWETPTIDYHALMSATRFVTRKQADVEQLFRRMVFNVTAHNRDDHAKQHALLMDASGTWYLAPAYDLTFSPGPGGEHYLAIGARATDVTLDDILAVAKRQSISAPKATAIVADVRAVVADFPRFASAYDVPSASVQEIAAVLNRHVGELAPRSTRTAATRGRTLRPSSDR